MASPMPPYDRYLESPAPTAKSFYGEATFEGGLVCTYYMADSETVARKKASFLEAGPQDVIIISDFDRTISRSFFIRTSPLTLCASQNPIFESLERPFWHLRPCQLRLAFFVLVLIVFLDL